MWFIVDSAVHKIKSIYEGNISPKWDSINPSNWIPKWKFIKFWNIGMYVGNCYGWMHVFSNALYLHTFYIDFQK